MAAAAGVPSRTEVRTSCTAHQHLDGALRPKIGLHHVIQPLGWSAWRGKQGGSGQHRQLVAAAAVLHGSTPGGLSSHGAGCNKDR